MALTTYVELKSAIASYMHRGDLTSVIPDFVTLAEKRIVDDLIQAGGHSAIEDSTALAVTSNEATLPTDYVGLRTVVSGDSTKREIPLVTLDKIKTRYQYAGTGYAASVHGSTLVLSPDAGAYSPTVYYYKTPTAMSADESVNELYPKLNYAYLYGALIEASIYAKQDPSQWASAYQSAIASVIKTDKRARWGNGLTVRAA